MENLYKHIQNCEDFNVVQKGSLHFFSHKTTSKFATYTSSQSTHYKVYPYDELTIYFNSFLYQIVCLIIYLSTFWLNLDNVTYVNNLFLSTNLYDSKFWDSILLETFNDDSMSPIIIRSINSTQIDKIKLLESKGFKRVLSRHINICNPSNMKKNHRANNVRDFNLLKKLVQNGTYTIHSYKSNPVIDHIKHTLLDDHIIASFILCYKSLYHEKYSKFNPNFTVNWLKAYAECQNTGFIWIQSEEKIIGIIGYYYIDGVLTTPLFGYDTKFIIKNNYSLYRALSVLIHCECKKLGLIENRSGGCADFKKQRGAKSVLEYSMVKTNHIPLNSCENFIKKLSWGYLSWLTKLVEFIYELSFNNPCK